jgi:hypothetical protein
MKKLMTLSFVLALLMSAVALAQYGSQQPDTGKSGTSMKAVSITGTISDDGKMFVSDEDGKRRIVCKSEINPHSCLGPGIILAFLTCSGRI